ncbi:MAG: hypothetical protein LBC75_01170 [Fibromonadaceae bacterium]|nr:hypothetical protein [Fibromonadaceae bacterium]
MEKEFLEKIFHAIFGRMGLGAIFLATTIFIWVQMRETQDKMYDLFVEQIKKSDARIESLMRQTEQCCMSSGRRNLVGGTE